LSCCKNQPDDTSPSLHVLGLRYVLQ
jgi:hypothetical protein